VSVLLKERQEKLAKLEKALAARFGEGAVGIASKIKESFKVDVIPTQSLAVNKALGIGGIPRGRITEIYGPEHTAKTGLAIGVLAEGQKMGLVGALVDAEHATTMEYLELLGVDPSALFISRPSSGEDALNIVDGLASSGVVDVIVVDSVAALTPIEEIEGEMGDSHVALQARLMSQAMRKLTHTVAKNNVALIFINQIREKVGVMFGNNETTPGGRALRFYASVRIELRRGEPIKEGDEQVGVKIKVRVTKNRLSPPYKRAEFPVYFGKRIDPIDELFILALDEFDRSGSIYTLLDESGKVIEGPSGPCRFKGKRAVKEAMREDPGLVEILKKRVLAKDHYEVETFEEEERRERMERRRAKKALEEFEDE